MRGRLEFLIGMLIMCLVAYSSYMYFRPDVRWHRNNMIGCIDAQGTLSVVDKNARYHRDGATVVGVDADGAMFFYTPPMGWVCKIEEIKD